MALELPQAGARIELQLQGQLDVVCQRTGHVIIEGVVEHNIWARLRRKSGPYMVSSRAL